MFHRTTRLGMLTTLLCFVAVCFAGVTCQASDDAAEVEAAATLGVTCVEAGKCFTSYGACETCEESP